MVELRQTKGTFLTDVAVTLHYASKLSKHDKELRALADKLTAEAKMLRDTDADELLAKVIK